MLWKDNAGIIIIIALFISANLIFLNFYSDVWWDSSVYIGMGKHIYSLGNSGLWEPIRPLTLPLILGLFWKIGANPLIYGKLLVLLMSIGTIILTYILANKLFNKQTAVLASIIISFSSLMLNVSHEILVEVPSVFLLLIGFYFYLKNNNYVAGTFFGLAFLTKFPTLLFLFVLLGIEGLLLLGFNKKDFLRTSKPIFKILVSFILITLPYFIFNFIYYKNALFPLTSAKYVIDNVVGCTILDLKPNYYYFPLIFNDNPLHLFFFFGLITIFFNKEDKYKSNKIQIIGYILAFLIYFTLLTCKTERYPILALPFISMITGYGICTVFSKLSKKKKIQSFIIIIVLITSLFFSADQIKDNSRQADDFEVYSYFKNQPISGEILTTTPEISVFTDKKLGLIYYSLDYYIKYTSENKQKISYIVLNTDDIPCNPADLECQKKTEKFISFLKSNFKIVYYKKINNDEHFIFSR